jgi:hypothetical protein
MMSKVRKSLLLVAAASALFATAALAGEITLFHGGNFAGEADAERHRARPRVDRFNDSAASVIVHDGVWEACTGIGFRDGAAVATG